MNRDRLRVLSVQPWYGGSHRQFNDGWASHSRHQWTTIGLPAKNWKWRMRHAAVDLARLVNERSKKEENWDIVVCTDMMNVAEFKTLAKTVRDLPLVVYFHENQFAYPNRGKQQPDHHFLFTNLTSALAADQVWFNSDFNRESMLGKLKEYSDGWPEFDTKWTAGSIRKNSVTIFPPIASSKSRFEKLVTERKQRITSGAAIHLVWAARWEYDKNPEDLLKCLELLEQQRVPFRLSVIGEQTDSCPPSFDTIQKKFELQIENWGYQESLGQYWSVLESADIILSTAVHEFFGLSVVEAISVGCWPLLPNRLAYPEVLEVETTPSRKEHFLYQSTAKDLAKRIRQLHQNRDWNFKALDSLTDMIRKKLDFPNCAEKMDQLLCGLIK